MVRSLLFASPALALVPGPWSDLTATPDRRAKALVSNMTLDEKLALFHGPASGPCCQCKDNATCAYVGNVAENSRLGIPPITMNDGPQGFRDDQHEATTTAWPSGLAMAASWDLEAMYEWGQGQGKEFYDKGSNVQLGPGLCLARVTRNGRNFEYLSGEDPYLGYQLVQPVIKGIQSQKVVANAKHFVLNNQETNRGSVDVEIDERTRFEMYYPPFQGAIDAGVGSFMCSYNKESGHWSCENPESLRHLKETMGFKGYVMSDWGATHSASIMAGLDMEMPSADYMSPQTLKAGLSAGNISRERIDDAATRILRPMFEVGVMDEPEGTWDWKKLDNNVTTEASSLSARKLSSLSTVLLKNAEGVLPLRQNMRIAVLGFGDSNAVVHAGGSGKVVPSYVSKPVESIRNAAGAAAKVSYDNGTDLQAAAKLAADADVAIVFVATLSTEGGDRPSLSLDQGCEVREQDYGDQCKGNNDHQNAMVSAVAAANPRTIVVASVPGAVLMPWSKEAASILTNFMPGQQAGNAITDVLFGKVNPSGKLPLTFPNMENETAMSPAQWPGLPQNDPQTVQYSEGLLVGYRFYDAMGIKFTTGFPFGHGLSYTEFGYSQLSMEGTKISVDVKNTGHVAGAEVVQLYLGFPKEAGEPPLQLKGFKKTKTLQPGETQKVVMTLSERDLSIWDSQAHAWSKVAGTFKVMVGSSSRDIRSQGNWAPLRESHEEALV